MKLNKLDGTETAASKAGEMFGESYELWQLMGCKKEVVTSGIYQRVVVPPITVRTNSAERIWKVLDELGSCEIADWFAAYRKDFIEMVKDHLQEIDQGGSEIRSTDAEAREVLNLMEREQASVDLGDGVKPYLLAEDISDVARDALSALIHIEVAERYLEEEDIPRFFLVAFTLGSIVHRLTIRPFEPLVAGSEKMNLGRSLGGTRTARLESDEWPAVERRIDQLIHIDKYSKHDACLKVRDELSKGENFRRPVKIGGDALRKRYNSAKQHQQSPPEASSEPMSSTDYPKFPPKLRRTKGRKGKRLIGPLSGKRRRRNPARSLPSEPPSL